MYHQLLCHPFVHSAFHSSFLSSVFTCSPYIPLLSFLPSKSLVIFPFLSLFISTFIFQNILLTYLQTLLSRASFLPFISSFLSTQPPLRSSTSSSSHSPRRSSVPLVSQPASHPSRRPSVLPAAIRPANKPSNYSASGGSSSVLHTSHSIKSLQN